MSKKTKILIFSKLVFFAIFVVLWFFLNYTFQNLSIGFKGMISAVFSFILAPRINYFKAQSGKEMHIKWIFLKNSIYV